jgi:hypothetical protein
MTTSQPDQFHENKRWLSELPLPQRQHDGDSMQITKSTILPIMCRNYTPWNGHKSGAGVPWLNDALDMANDLQTTSEPRVENQGCRAVPALPTRPCLIATSVGPRPWQTFGSCWLHGWGLGWSWNAAVPRPEGKKPSRQREVIEGFHKTMRTDQQRWVPFLLGLKRNTILLKGIFSN